MSAWEDIENAMHTAVLKASGLDPDQIIWSYQNVNETGEGTYVELNFGDVRPVGVDRIGASEDLTRANGQEIAQQVKGIREAVFDIQCFTAQTGGEPAARWLAETIRTYMRLDSVQRALRKVQVSVFDLSGTVRWIPDIPAVGFRGRASLEMRCYVPPPVIVEYVGYISRIRGTIYPVGWQGISGASGLSFDSNNAP